MLEQQQQLPEFEGFSLKKKLSNENTISFPVLEILHLMVDSLVEEVKKTISISNSGIFKKYDVSEELFNKYCSEMDVATDTVLREMFSKDISERFSQEDVITLSFYQNTIYFKISNIKEKRTNDIRILFLILFVKNLNETIVINSNEPPFESIHCENEKFITKLKEKYGFETKANMIVIGFKSFPFPFTSEDILNEKIVNARFKAISKWREN